MMSVKNLFNKVVDILSGGTKNVGYNEAVQHEDPKIVIEQLLKAIKNPLIFEIGAHMGTDTVWFRQIANNPTIHFFEPDPRNATIIKNNGIDKLAGNFFNEAAVGKKSGETSFYLSTGKRPDPLYPHDHTDSSSLKEPAPEMLERFKWLSFKQKVTVDVITLDEYCASNNIGHIDFIWADTQGAEADVILGGQKMLSKTRYLFTEYCDIPLYKDQASYSQILSLLPGKWRVIKKYSDDVILENMTYR